MLTEIEKQEMRRDVRVFKAVMQTVAILLLITIILLLVLQKDFNRLKPNSQPAEKYTIEQRMEIQSEIESRNPSR